MTLPAIDIPVKLPFDVPVLIHPVFVHFAIAIPVIVLLIELINLKARNRAVSLTSLFLMTLMLLVYAGAWFSGKADGSHAFALLEAEAKEELKFHKLLGTYLVYAAGALFVFKLLAMMVKANWARDIFLVFLLVFIGGAVKQGKDGGELVYEYGVNVEPVVKLQDRVDEMGYDIEDLRSELKKAKEGAAPATETSEATQTPAPAEEEAPAATHEAQEAAQTAGDDAVHAAKQAAESIAQTANEAAKNTEEAVNSAVEAAKTEAHEAAKAATEAAHDAAKAAEEAAHEAVHDATQAADEATDAASAHH